MNKLIEANSTYKYSLGKCSRIRKFYSTTLLLKIESNGVCGVAATGAHIGPKKVW